MLTDTQGAYKSMAAVPEDYPILELFNHFLMLTDHCTSVAPLSMEDVLVWNR